MNPLLVRLHGASRRKKQRLFDALMGAAPASRILNVGASGASHGLPDQFETFYPHLDTVVGGGLAAADVRDYATSFPRVRAVIFDGRALPFGDRSFDIVYSNAVIEHLPGVDAQQQFADEIRRVGRGWFVTTPNRRFIVEPHYHLPLVQFLPEPTQRALVRRLGRTPYPALTLLSAGDLRRLFPESEVIGCRVTLYAETLIAYRAPRSEPSG